MVLTYSTIFLVSLLVVLVALYFYRLISNARRSISRSKQRITGSGDALHRRAAAAVASGSKGGATARDLAGTHPAMPQMYKEQNTVWPYRENRSASIGSSYKVKRRTLSKKPNQATEGKPWGW